MESDTSSSEARLGSGPLIFSGVPPLLTGDIELANVSDQKVKVRGIPVVQENPAMANLGLDELRVGVRLAPRQRVRTRAHFLIDPYTPPGSYAAELTYGTEPQRMVAHVFEKLELWLQPEVIQLRGAGGDVLTALVVISNRGNVTEALRNVALVFLEERDWVGRSLVSALREMKAEEGAQNYFDRVVHELHSSISRPARVTLLSAVSDLQPGETAEVRLEIRLPNELIKGRTYVGSTQFMSARLSFEVECSGATNSTKRRPR